MKRNQSDEFDVAHVFDQTNGIVDLGADEPARPQPADEGNADRNRTVGGIAMMSVKKP